MSSGIDYEIVRRRGVRSFTLRVHENARVVVRAPRSALVRDIDAFVSQHIDWIHKEREAQLVRGSQHPISFSRKRYIAHKEASRALILSRVGFLNEHYNFKVGRISIRDQKTLWGSAAKGGNLNFNYRLLYLPLTLQEYVIVHELCHLGEHNHSKAFWALVEFHIPDYKKRDKALNRYTYMLRY
ncbi:MAG: DUF45 domain-containing protein [bacterium]|nr:DUF45 domain-containing protein [bacterium]